MPPKIAAGGIRHAELLLKAGFIVDEADPRWSPRVIDALVRKEHRYSERFPDPLTPVRWFAGYGDDPEIAARAVAELKAEGLLS